MGARRVQNVAAGEGAASLLNAAREVLLAIGEDMTPATRGHILWAGYAAGSLTCTINMSMPRGVTFAIDGEPLAVFELDEAMVQ